MTCFCNKENHLPDSAEEQKARKQLLIGRTETGPKSAAAWIEVGEFIADSDSESWSGLTAKACFRAALDLLPVGAHNGFRADALLGYGAALTKEGSGYRDEVLEEAIGFLTEAIALFKEIPDPEGVLEARYYRAYAWTELVGPQRYSSAERALDELQSLRKALRMGDDPTWRANIDFLIGNAFLDRVDGDPRQNNQQAKRAFRSGLRFFSRTDNRAGLAQGYLNLAVAHNQSQRLGDLDATPRAIACARKAWQHCTDEVPVELRTSILSNLANALAERGGRQWVSNTHKAEAILAQGIELGLALESPASQIMRLVRAGLVLGLVQYQGEDRMAEVMSDLAACEGAFDPIQTTQWWLEWMELKTLAAAVQDYPEDMIQLAEEALNQSDNILVRTEAFSEKSHLLSQLALIADLGILGHLKTGGPVDGLIFARRVYGRILGFDPQIFEQPDSVAELYLLNPSTEDWTGVILAAGDNCDLYPLEGIGKEFWSDAQDGLEQGFFSGMADLQHHRGTTRFTDALEEWIVKISAALGPVLFDLREAGFSEVVVFAFGAWCTVPVAALQMPGPTSNQLIDHMTVAYGPDQHQQRPVTLRRVLHVIDESLSEALLENRLLLRLAEQVTECRTLAEVQAALTGGEDYDVIHFTTHGAHDFDYLDGAGIECADRGLLTARWVFEYASLNGSPLVCLAACQTGLADFSNLPHETFGLPTAFLASGASAVISSQWPIDDVATRLVMERVYEGLKQGMNVATALRSAQRWLRDEDQASLEATSTGAKRFTSFDIIGQNPDLQPFSHPYFWAGFLLHRA